MKKLLAMVVCIALLACTVSTVAGAEANTKLTIALWDDSQTPGIQKMVDKFTQDNPGISAGRRRHDAP
jgi:ABC-type glycerol-3-phosphate transport system substrate-binding protein